VRCGNYLTCDLWALPGGGSWAIKGVGATKRPALVCMRCDFAMCCCAQQLALSLLAPACSTLTFCRFALFKNFTRRSVVEGSTRTVSTMQVGRLDLPS